MYLPKFGIMAVFYLDVSKLCCRKSLVELSLVFLEDDVALLTSEELLQNEDYLLLSVGDLTNHCC